MELKFHSREFHVKYSSSWNSSFLEFLEKIQVELEFHELEYFTWNSSVKKKKKKNSKPTFSITQCSKNQVLHLKLDFQKIEFQNRGIFLISFRHRAFCWKFCEKGVRAHFKVIDIPHQAYPFYNVMGCPVSYVCITYNTSCKCLKFFVTSSVVPILQDQRLSTKS